MRKKNIYYIYTLIAVVVLAFILIANNRSSKLNTDTDYYVFWKAGQDYFSGHSLYDNKETRPYIYPPFAAFTFQLLYIIPFKASAFLFFLVNALLLLPLCVLLLFKICHNLGFERRKIQWPIVLATICSLKFFWNNLVMFQVNFLVFALCLIGVYLISKKKPAIASALFVIGTFIKIYPLFLLVYCVLYYRTSKVIYVACITAVLCLLLPAMQRGFYQSHQDHLTYKEVFLDNYKNGGVGTSYKNHTLKSFVLKAFYPETRNEKIDISLYATPLLVSNLFLMLLLLLLFIHGFIHYKIGSYFSLFGLSCIFIFSHLISGITWTAHLVSSLFFLLPLFLIRYRQLNKLEKIVYCLLVAMVVLMGIEGSDTTGKTIYYAIRNFDLFVILMLSLFAFYSYIILSKKEKTLLPQGIEE